MTFYQFLQSRGYPQGILCPKWMNLSNEQKTALRAEWKTSQ